MAGIGIDRRRSSARADTSPVPPCLQKLHSQNLHSALLNDYPPFVYLSFLTVATRLYHHPPARTCDLGMQPLPYS